MFTPLEKNIEYFAGEEISKQVMADSEKITEKTDKQVTALWVKGAMERLDLLVDEKTRAQIMENCGVNCAAVNKRVIERGKTKRKQFKTTDDFLAAEVKKPNPGTRLEREGNLLYQYYTPSTYFHPMRCYCALLRQLPKETNMSSTYCNCAKGFVKTYWERC
ncbi:MAG: hypothetical protein NWF00_08585 [Candidatus Bathyarchaeota archaeon]|nr:hypothetical protein [Candidatus Bathyarchaeota archaeon]